jgi:hypothetical protein
MATEVTETKGMKNTVLSSVTHKAVLIFMAISLLQNSSGYVADIGALSPLRCFMCSGQYESDNVTSSGCQPLLKNQLLVLLTRTTKIVSQII